MQGEGRAVSLYVHVPFCRKKCDYCDFFSMGQNTCAHFDTLKADYVSAVVQEVHFYAQYYNVSCWKTVYIGGGTPSQLAPAQVEALLRGIFSAAPAAPGAEITMEVNPDDVTEALLASCARAGIQRISMGVQAFDQRALDGVRRGASSQAALRALELLQARWQGRLSCDLIAGLPRHTYASFADGVRTLVAFPNVDHISLYTLTVEDGTPLARQIAAGTVRWSPEKADRLWLCGRNLLERAGFSQYEVSNFSKPGAQSRHNLTYWHLQDYIGCGAGASGSVYGVRGGEGLRWTNTTDVAAYNAFWLSCAPAARPDGDPAQEEPALPRTTEVLSAATQEFEFLMMGFRLLSGVSAEEYKEVLELRDKGYCSFIEDMWLNGDENVVNIVEVTILERLSDDKSVWNKFGKHISNDFIRFINNVVLAEML